MSLSTNQTPNQNDFMLSPPTIHTHRRRLFRSPLAISHILFSVEQMGEDGGRVSESEFPYDFTFGAVEMSAFVFFGEVYLVGDGEGVAGWIHGLYLIFSVLWKFLDFGQSGFRFYGSLAELAVGL